MNRFLEDQPVQKQRGGMPPGPLCRGLLALSTRPVLVLFTCMPMGRGR